MSKTKAPEVVELSTAQLEELLAKLAQLLPAELYQLVEKLLRTLQWVMGVLQAKEITLGRLRRMIFGAKTEKSHNLLAEVGGAKPQAPKPKAKGHGRKAAQDYPGALKKPPAEKFCRYARSPQQHGAVSPPASPSRLCFSSLAHQGDPIMEGRLIRANRHPAENLTFSRTPIRVPLRNR